ncbi:MAG: UPF0280 family protein, partial [Deltaproteobacteria bacterium]|nr:UPF0280 family protein [Deltaproteobacteria bacterium]
ETREAILSHRATIESFIGQYPEFASSLVPLTFKTPVPPIIADMLQASRHAGVGPMAAVAGSIAAYVGADLLTYSSEIIIENGGDVFLQTHQPVTIGIFANQSVLNLRVGIEVVCNNRPLSVCTSSGTFGHSLSQGKADAVTVLSSSCPLADAAATAIGNTVQTKFDIDAALEFGKHIKGVKGLVVIKDDKAGIWGDMKIVRL